MKNIRERINRIINIISKDLYEREEVVSLTLLSSIAGKAIFLYGPPGTAKSFIARRISLVFRDSKYFGYLMQRFSTPEDIFGPISLEELKNDKYVRKIEGYLPDSDFAFLDEIWKSTPAILNTLLTIINERVFKNGTEEINVPLKVLISASNETPPDAQGLEALYDRFIMRLMVKPISDKDNFKKIIQNTDVCYYMKIDDKLKISADEWIEIRKEANNVTISKAVIDIIHNIKLSIEQFNIDNKNIQIYISDRRWQHISYLLKMAAYLNNKNEVGIYDIFFIYNCLWNLEEHIEIVKNIVENSIKLYFNFNNDYIDEWRKNIKNIQERINNEFYNSKKVYYTENIDDKEYIIKTLYIKIDEYGNNGDTIIYIPLKQLSKNGYFYPLDIGLNTTKKFRCNFNGSEKCRVEINSSTALNGFLSNKLSRNYELLLYAEPEFYMKIVNPVKVEKSKKDSYIKLISELISGINDIIINLKNDFANEIEKSKNIFISDEHFSIYNSLFDDCILKLENDKLNAERLMSEIENHETI